MGLGRPAASRSMCRTVSTATQEARRSDAAFIAALQTHPELTGINTFFRPTVPQLRVEVDEEKALALGIPLAERLSETLQARWARCTSTTSTRPAAPIACSCRPTRSYRMKPDDLGKVYVRSATSNAMIPLSAVSRSRTIVGPEQVERFNGFVAAKVMGDSKPGQLGRRHQDRRGSCAATLPAGYEIAWTGQAFQEKRTGSSSVHRLRLRIIMVFLILAAQYERWSLPLAVVMAVPFA
jgi:multidrug efflux pump subunit AcrB